MRHIDRLNIPEVLNRNHAKWQADFNAKKAANPQARPDSSKYAHKDIRKQLMSMSHNKCFYCEGMLLDRPKEVDHYVEVAVDHSKAFDWNNLYMACLNCNDKVPHNTIPVSAALNPILDSDADIKTHISFDKEIIFPMPGSLKGKQTITKFRLDTDLLNAQRRDWIIKIDGIIIDILKKMVAEGRQSFSDEELSVINRFMDSASPFSLMSEVYIKRKLHGLLP
ncbi:MAG: HNH endonuclease [Muribaculaceae bacterium]|nr:HNH endonuclease [Muribaculaceae bacterium]